MTTRNAVSPRTVRSSARRCPWLLALALAAAPSTACFHADDDTGDTNETSGQTGADTDTTGTTDNPGTTSETTASSTDDSTTTDSTTTDSTTTDSTTTDDTGPDLPPPCLSLCDPAGAPSCADDMTSIACVEVEPGCHDFVENPCQAPDVCVPFVGCTELVPQSCAAWLADDPLAPNGTYFIDPDGLGGLPEFEVVCDMTGGGWTLVALNDQTADFNFFDRSWVDYKDGFGMLLINDRGWLGNDRLHALTSAGAELEVRRPGGVHLYDFAVGDEASDYQLSLATTPASADGGHFAIHDGMAFSTFDNDNDLYEQNCAEQSLTGWWFHACFDLSIAADGGYPKVYWRDAGGNPLQVNWIQMWVR